MEARPFHCPACGTSEIPANKLARAKLMEVGLCQGCRAGKTFQRNPQLLPLFVAFWSRHGFPASDFWLEAAGASPEAAEPMA
jgi:hypothetical protein